MFAIKVKYGDDLRRFQMEESKLSWATFVPELISRFELDITSQVSLRYEDEEGDKITVSSETEFREALVFSLKQRSTLKLEMTVSHLLPSSSSFDQPLLSPSLSSSLSLSASSSALLEPTSIPPSFEAQFDSFLGGSSSNLTPSGPSDPSQIVDELGSIFSGLSLFHAPLPTEPPAPLEQPEQPPSQVPFAPEPSSAPELSTPEPSIIPEPSPPAALEQPVRPIHTGVICDGCRQTIAGFRFKCGHCPDFDLCEACEAAGAHFPNHFLIKIPFPIPPESNSDWFAKRVFLPQVHLSEHLSLPVAPPPKPEPTLPPTPQRETTPQEPPKKVETPKEPAGVAPSSSPPSTTEPEAKFVGDVTIPDGTVVKPGASFTKTWTLKNSGEVRWPMQSRLKMTGGTQMGALQSTVVASPLPGANVEISLLLTSPITPGRYVSYWRLHTPNGQPFGNRVWCDIVVLDPSSSQEPLPSEEEEEAREQSSPTPAPEQPERLRGQSFVRETSPSPFIALNVPVPDDERYEQEMKALLSMGFCDRTTNFRKLKEANGNLQVVVDQLLHEHEDDWFQRR